MQVGAGRLHGQHTRLRFQNLARLVQIARAHTKKRLLVVPLDYPDLVSAMRHATLILTDSGGIQEEAPTFGTPVMVVRAVTERPEGIEAGVAELLGTSRRLIVERASAKLAEDRPTARPNPYGDGRAGERIADIVVSSLTGRPRAMQDWSP
jgi:UDP-N-acetylglucosamine 2-epimerase (non-hydrolysing)